MSEYPQFNHQYQPQQIQIPQQQFQMQPQQVQMSEYPQFTQQYQPQQIEVPQQQQLEMQQQQPMNMNYNAFPAYNQNVYNPGNNYEPAKSEYQFDNNANFNVQGDQSGIVEPKYSDRATAYQKNNVGIRRTSTFNQRYISHDHWTLTENSQGCFGNTRKVVFKYHHFCFPSYCLLSTVFITTILILSNINKKDIKGFSGTLYTLENNLNGNPISDITLIPSGSTCPNGYSLMNLGIWPGTDAYCNCGSSILSFTDFSTGSCSSKQRARGCTSINFTPSQNYYVWRGNSFCAKYITNSLSLTSCPLGYTTCYSGGCYPSNGGCPITNASYFPNVSPPLFNYLKDNQSQPIIGFHISMNGLPCLDHSRAPSYNDFPPLSALRPIGCPITDPGANYSLDQYDEISLLNNNGMNSLLAISGYQGTIQGSQANLIAIQKYQVENSTFCLGLTPDCFTSIQDIINDYLNSFFGFSIGTIVCLCCIGLGYTSSQKLRKGDEWFKNKQNCSMILQYILVLILNLGGVITVFILELVLILKHIQEKNSASPCLNQINQIVNNQCFVESISDSLVYFTNLWHDKTQVIIGLASTALAISAAFLPIHIIYFMFYFKKKD